jgi:hypothetical protein
VEGGVAEGEVTCILILCDMMTAVVIVIVGGPVVAVVVAVGVAVNYRRLRCPSN